MSYRARRPVEHDVEDPVTGGIVVAGNRLRHARQQADEIPHRDVDAFASGLLRPGQQHIERLAQSRAVGRIRVLIGSLDPLPQRPMIDADPLERSDAWYNATASCLNLSEYFDGRPTLDIPFLDQQIQFQGVHLQGQTSDLSVTVSALGASPIAR